jgi:hypothetical protein
MTALEPAPQPAPQPAPKFVELEVAERNAVSGARAQQAAVHPRIVATSFVYRDADQIPPRQWLYGRHYIRNFLSTTVAPGGVGKSSLSLAECLAMATGRDLLGVAPASAINVWYWNGEDPAEETERRIAALCQHYKIDGRDLAGRLFVDSGRLMPITIASMNGAKVAVATNAIDQICAAITANNIGVLIIDPFVSCHTISENDNGAIDAVAKAWSQIADRTNASVELVHHVRKPAQGQAELTIEDARGGSALINAARVGRVLNRMSSSEASTAKVEDRRAYFRADHGKANLAPMEAATWFRIVPVTIANGDNVAVVMPWTMPAVLDDVTTADMHRVRETVVRGNYRKDIRSPQWVGNAVATVLNLEVDKDEARIKAILKIWFANGVLATERRLDGERKEREFVVPGNWNESDDSGEGGDLAPV